MPNAIRIERRLRGSEVQRSQFEGMKNLPEDSLLLQRFCNEASQEAFAELVRRHIDMVYAAAVRQVKDPATAEDVVQGTFIVLARKARLIGKDTVVSAWLLNAARFVAMDAIRARKRRDRHEQCAASERLVKMDSDAKGDHRTASPLASSHDFRLSALEEAMDRALARLSWTAREILVLRFFEDRSFSEISSQLHISEPAVRQRTTRALKQLRATLLRSGVQMDVDRLGNSLSGLALLPSPRGLAGSVVNAAIKGAASPAPSIWARTAMRQMSLVNLKLAIASAATTCLILAGGITITHLAVAKPAQARPSPAIVLASAQLEQTPAKNLSQVAGRRT